MEREGKGRPDGIEFGPDGLLPVIVQDHRNGEILMLAYTDRSALELTLETKQAWFWSRSRKKLWHKGEESGNTMRVMSVALDCDSDTLLLQVVPAGPACHTGSDTCFLTQGGVPLMGTVKRFGSHVIDDMDDVVQSRKAAPSDDSYTCRLLSAGTERILRKVAEESGEFIVAAMKAKMRGSDEDLEDTAGELADLLYHSSVALASVGMSLKDVEKVLAGRRGKPASAEKLAGREKEY